MPDLPQTQETVPPLFAGRSQPRREPRSHTPVNQTAGKRARETALTRVSKGVSPQWKQDALEAVRQCAIENRDFISDSVWGYLEEKPAEARAMGPIMRKAEKVGYCSKTDQFRPTPVIANHRTPKRVWKSNIYEGARNG